MELQRFDCLLFLLFLEEMGYQQLNPKEFLDESLDQSLQGFDTLDFDREVVRVIFGCLSNLDMVLIYFLMDESLYFILYPQC